MTTNQLFFAIAGLFIAFFGAFSTWIKWYVDSKIDAKIDPIYVRLDEIDKKLDLLINYMISHEGRISILEERTKNK